MGQPQDQRIKLHEILDGLSESAHVYFQPPSNVQMEYPCIVYRRDSARTVFADNAPYKRDKRYLVTVIDRDPDSDIPEKVSKLPMCSFDRHFAVDNLNHDVYSLYF